MLKQLLVLITLLVGAGQALGSDTELAQLEVQSSLSSATAKAGHGMIVFGQKSIYMYHLPMWTHHHAWHLIIEVALDSEGLALYEADKAAGSRLQSFNPNPFALANLKPGFTFSGTLFQGHFEQGGRPLPLNSAATRVTATVKRIITAQALSPQNPGRSSAIYRVFGSEGAYFAAHLPATRPDFDQVIAVDAGLGCEIPEQALAGLTVRLDKLSNTARGRPLAGTSLLAQTRDDGNFCLTVKDESYFSTSDLGN